MQQCFLFAGVCWLQVCAAHATRPQLPVLLKMEPVQPRRMTYAEQLEAMRPPCGFCILADGTILLSNRPETYTAEMVVDAYEAWRKMKADGLVRETRPAAQWAAGLLLKQERHPSSAQDGTRFNVYFFARDTTCGSMSRMFFIQEQHPSWVSHDHDKTAYGSVSCVMNMRSEHELDFKFKNQSAKKTRFDQFWCKLEKLEIVYLKKLSSLS